MKKSIKVLRKHQMEETDKNQRRRIVREDSQIFVLRPGGYAGINWLTKTGTCRRRNSKCKGPEAEGACIFDDLKGNFHGWSREQENMCFEVRLVNP